MAKGTPRNTASDLRGAGRLAVAGVVGLTHVVENLHHNISRVPGPLGAVERAPMGGVSGFVYRSIRGIARVVGGGLDLALGQLALRLAEEPSSARREALLAALNGVLGDHLAASGNPLAIPMRLRRRGLALELTREALRAAIPRPDSRVVVMVHGLCRNDLQWRRNGHDHGASLEADASVLYLHYNTGRRVADNGLELDGMLEALARAWPVKLEDIAIVAHSMGGLVIRSACEQGAAAGRRWPGLLRSVVFLGTPHSGAALERGGAWLDAVLDASPYTAAFARLGRIRSAGITDLRHGLRTPLPAGVACHAIAGSLARRAGAREAVLGDGLVPLDSALGRAAGPAGSDLFPAARQSIAQGVGHLGLLSSKRVDAMIRAGLPWGEAGPQGPRETTLQAVGGQG
jgi:hypothetical protein